MSLKVVLTAPQRAFVMSQAAHPAIIGGLGSGKSRAGTMRLVTLMLSDGNANGAYYMPTYDLLHLRAIPGVEQDLESIGVKYKTVKAPNPSISIEGFGKIIFRSYDNPGNIIAYEVAHSICDELDTLPKDKAAFVWRKINERNRQPSKRKNSVGLVTTPDQGISGFVYEKWKKNPAPGYELHKASTRSNPFNPPEYVQNILNNYDPILAELYIEGEFVSLTQNKVYHFFDRVRHHTSRKIEARDTVIHVGLDFNIGGCCAVAFLIENNSPIAVDEFISYDTREIITNLSARYKGKTVIIYPDASGQNGHTNASQSDVAMIRSAGYQVNCYGENPAVRDRINAYNALLAHDRLTINTDTCPNLTNALESQGYNDKGEPEKWKKHPSIDDWADCSGYFIAYKYPIGASMTQIRLGGY